MNEKIKSRWMSLEIASPFIMASLTLVSHVSLSKHVEYYKRICDKGVGAIVLPSINPHYTGSAEKNNTIADCLLFDTGLNNKHKMGFTVLGPTSPNIVSVDYGINLAQNVKKCCKSVPILGSVANLGTNEEIISSVVKLCETRVDGIELNFSCPNVVLQETNHSHITIQLLREIRRICDLPISIKITPDRDYTEMISLLNGEVDGITVSNAYIGLIPPNIENEKCCPFESRSEWAPSGMYGPFERTLTFKRLFDYSLIAKEKELSLACVGGIVSAQEAIQAIMLGADVVQLSSAVLWQGVSVFESFNKFLNNYLDEKRLENIEKIKRSALSNIKKYADLLEAPERKIMKVNNERCCRCQNCYCCNRLCIAISQNPDKSVVIDEDLCSGCQICRQLCPNFAIEEKVII